MRKYIDIFRVLFLFMEINKLLGIERVQVCTC